MSIQPDDRRTHVERINAPASGVPLNFHMRDSAPSQPEAEPENNMLSDAQFQELKDLLAPVIKVAELVLADHQERDAERAKWEAEKAQREALAQTQISALGTTEVGALDTTQVGALSSTQISELKSV